MVIVMRKKFCFGKGIALCAMLFFIAIDSMQKKPKKELKKITDILFNCGLAPVYFPQNIAVTVLMRPHLNFQDVGRMGQVNKTCNGYWDPDTLCLGHNDSSSIQECPVLACRRLACLCYDRRTRALSHYAQQDNAAMFMHIWNYEKSDRRFCMYINYPKMVHMEGYESSDVVTLDFCMKKYRKHYCTEEKIHSRYFKILMRGIGYKNYSVWDVILLKKILPGSKFNIFTIKCRRQQARYNGWCKKRYLIGATKDVNLLVAIIGGRVEPYMFDKVFYSVDKHMVEALFEMDAVNLDQCDKLGNSAYSYYQYKMHPPVYTGGSSGRGGIR